MCIHTPPVLLLLTAWACKSTFPVIPDDASWMLLGLVEIQAPLTSHSTCSVKLPFVHLYSRGSSHDCQLACNITKNWGACP